MNAVSLSTKTHRSIGSKLVAAAVAVGVVALLALSVSPNASASEQSNAHAQSAGTATAAKAVRKHCRKAHTVHRHRRPCRKKPVARKPMPPAPQQAPQTGAPAPEQGTAPQQQAVEQAVAQTTVTSIRALETVGGGNFCADYGGSVGLCAQPQIQTVCQPVWVPMTYYKYPYLLRYFNWFNCNGSYRGYSDLHLEYRPDLGSWYGWQWGPYVTY
jgi:hypothetical protein